MNKVMPHSKDAEDSLLGCCLIDEDAIGKINDVLCPEDFYVERNQYLFKVLQDMYKNNTQIDLITVCEELKGLSLRTKGITLFDWIGGTEFLTQKMNFVPTANNIYEYSKIIRQKSLRRKIIKQGVAMVEHGYDDTKSEIQVLEDAENSVFQLRKTNEDNSPHHISYSSDEVILHATSPDSRGILTGYNNLDETIGGLREGNVIIVGAQTSVGKTAFALAIANNVAKQDIPVLFVTLEMPQKELHIRLLSFETGINLGYLFNGKCGDNYNIIFNAVQEMKKRPIYIDDRGQQSIYSIRSTARKFKREHGIQLLVIDYFQQITPMRFNQSLNASYTEISNVLKGLAMNVDIPVICCSQLSRAVHYKDNKRPQLYDLRESGAIEQGADIVLMLYRDSYHNDSAEAEDDGRTEVIIRKNRNGRSNVRLHYTFVKETAKFIEREVVYE